MKRVAICLAWLALASIVVACSLVLGLKDGDLTSTGDAGDGGSVGDERPVVTPDASTATCGEAGARNILADSDSVYVLSQGSEIVSSCGSRADPCGSVATGLIVANGNRAKAIYIGPGTYAEQLALPSGVSVEGGFTVSGSTWTPLCENITTILAPNKQIAATADNILNAAIRFLTIETKSHGDPGESLFGLVANNSALTLDNVNLIAELGGQGTSGTIATGSDTSNTDCTGSATAGNPGAPNDAGAFTADAYTPGTSAGSGTNGTRGAGGTYKSPTCSTTCVDQCNAVVYPTDDAGIPIDDAGNEIPDGATGECDMTTKSLCGADVTATCGGPGGLGGGGGGGGAASVAVFANGPSTVITIVGGSLASAGGGLGGPGGAGAAGVKGDDPRSGQSATCYTTCDVSCKAANQTALMGASSTVGGTGGTGGTGGGGMGGPTFLIVTFGGATVTSSQTDQWKIPTAGAPGGAPNGIAGAFGESSP